MIKFPFVRPNGTRTNIIARPNNDGQAVWYVEAEDGDLLPDGEFEHVFGSYALPLHSTAYQPAYEQARREAVTKARSFVTEQLLIDALDEHVDPATKQEIAALLVKGDLPLIVGAILFDHVRDIHAQ